MHLGRNVLMAGLLVLVVGSLVGCDALESINPFDNEKEVTGLVEELGDDYLVVKAVRYNVTSDTKFEGITGLADLAVGDEVEVEYKESSGARTAVEIDKGSD